MRQHVPHQVAKYAGVLEQILDRLYETDHARLDEQCLTLMLKQSNFTSTGVAGITYGGKIYTTRQYQPMLASYSKEYTPVVDASLQDEFLPHVQAVELLNQEKQSLRQSLVVVLRRCNEDQDVRDMLPDCATKGIADIGTLERTRPVGFLFSGSPQLAERYRKTVEKMEMLSIVKLFY